MTGHHSLTFYRLVPVLRRDAKDVHCTLRHLREGKSTQRVRPSVLKRDARLHELWQQYRDKEIETGAVLAECAKFFGPVIDTVAPTQPAVQVTRLKRIVEILVMNCV
ncbi:hypothetical protein DPMN_151722 [Dreissena polymorpha]|uniref:Uncharacterized protein n=1 Tax=Dreissena polymorpha TaxID=45954 RepID=A0A9D4FH17_DREPO|nr:hypothetical protein DPMN_151722 [Dreissena polymorpha]